MTATATERRVDRGGGGGGFGQLAAVEGCWAAAAACRAITAAGMVAEGLATAVAKGSFDERALESSVEADCPPSSPTASGPPLMRS